MLTVYETDVCSGKEMASELKITTNTVRNRAKRREIVPFKNIGKISFYTDEQIELIAEEYCRLYYKPIENEIEIVEHFLKNDNNAVEKIAKIFGVTPYTVSAVIDRYFERGCVIRQSKMNYEN